MSLADAQWSLTITFLVGAVATPVLGRLGDGPHRRAVVLVALGLVVLGSVLAALPLPFGALLAGRGAAGRRPRPHLASPSPSRATALEGERSRSAVALLSITTVAGVGLGYPLTGLVAQAAGCTPRSGSAPP